MRYLTRLLTVVVAVFVLGASAHAVEQMILKVSIVVDGMMKSKSGAT